MTRGVFKAIFVLVVPMVAGASVSATCYGVSGIPSGNGVSCSVAGADGLVTATASDFKSATADKESGPVAFNVGVAQVSDLLKVVVTGGSGAAFLNPCMYAEYADTGGSGTAAFGSVSLAGAQQGVLSCGKLAYSIPIVFGVPLVANLSLTAIAGGIFGSGEADFYGFDVLNANGAPISATITTTVLTPEPSALIFCLVGLAASLMRRERHQP